jgi:hypothetical protein
MRNELIQRWIVIGLFIALCGCHSKTDTSSTGANSPDSSASAAAQVPAAPPPPATEPAPPPPPPPIVVDAGTQLVVSVDQDVSTKTNSTGDHFAAFLAAPVTVDGVVALPKGAKVDGTVVNAAQAGRVKGGAALSVTLDSITVNGNKYSISTSTYAQTSKGRGQRTAVGAGGGAAAGAIIGGLAGGGKGAAIGLLAGGGAGTAGAAYTGNRDLTIPAETRVRLRLRKPLSIPQQ